MKQRGRQRLRILTGLASLSRMKRGGRVTPRNIDSDGQRGLPGARNADAMTAAFAGY